QDHLTLGRKPCSFHGKTLVRLSHGRQGQRELSEAIHANVQSTATDAEPGTVQAEVQLHAGSDAKRAAENVWPWRKRLASTPPEDGCGRAAAAGKQRRAASLSSMRRFPFGVNREFART